MAIKGRHPAPLKRTCWSVNSFDIVVFAAASSMEAVQTVWFAVLIDSFYCGYTFCCLVSSFIGQAMFNMSEMYVSLTLSIKKKKNCLVYLKS